MGISQRVDRIEKDFWTVETALAWVSERNPAAADVLSAAIVSQRNGFENLSDEELDRVLDEMDRKLGRGQYAPIAPEVQAVLDSLGVKPRCPADLEVEARKKSD